MMRGVLGVLVSGLILVGGRAEAQTLIQRTITVDGASTDWTSAPAITTNPGQFATDCEVATPCETDAVQSTGRDLRRFAYTWDATYLYFYVERFASSSNTTEWLFYLDEDVDGKMETGERIFRVDWQGSNRSTDGYLCVYTQAAPGGDVIGGDGETLPGQGGSCVSQYTGITGGTLSGVEMESRLEWSALGSAGPKNVAFHISSSRGMNLPSQVEDNMGGPGGGGGQLFPPDLAVSIGSTETQVSYNEVFTLTITLQNVYFDNYSNIAVNVTLPSQVAYVSHTAPAGTSFTDTNGDGRRDRWTITSLGPQAVRQLQVQLRGNSIPIGVTVADTATLSAYTGTDTQAGNNRAIVSFTVQPSPSLSMTKTASVVTSVPGGLVRYEVTTTNATHAVATQVLVQTAIDPRHQFSLDGFAVGVPFQFANGAIVSGLTMGTTQFSADGGLTWNYTPQSGAGGAPPGYDGNVTHWRIFMNGTMQSHGASFRIRYWARVE